MRKPMPVRTFAAALLGGFLLAACQTPEQALLDSGQSQVKLRSIQTRSFDTTDKEKTLRTVIATMQDLNFVIDKADLALGTVTATKLDRYMLRMTVSVRPRGQTQLLVRANANFGLKPVTEPEPYQKFFASLGKAMFLTAHEEGAGNEKEQALEKTAPAGGPKQQAGLVAPPAAAPEPPIPLAIAQPSVAATSPSSRIAMPRPGTKKGRTFSARQLTLLFSGSTVTATEFGATCVGKYETERTFKISPDGTFSVSTQCEGYSGEWIILDDDSGTWRVAGDWVCMAFRSRPDDDDECWAVKNTRLGFVALGPGGGVKWHLAISNPRYSSKEALLAALNTAKAGTP